MYKLLVIAGARESERTRDLPALLRRTERATAGAPKLHEVVDLTITGVLRYAMHWPT